MGKKKEILKMINEFADHAVEKLDLPQFMKEEMDPEGLIRFLNMENPAPSSPDDEELEKEIFYATVEMLREVLLSALRNKDEEELDPLSLDVNENFHYYRKELDENAGWSMNIGNEEYIVPLDIQKAYLAARIRISQEFPSFQEQLLLYPMICPWDVDEIMETPISEMIFSLYSEFNPPEENNSEGCEVHNQ